jgi:hypothetical protein
VLGVELGEPKPFLSGTESEGLQFVLVLSKAAFVHEGFERDDLAIDEVAEFPKELGKIGID